MTERLKQISIIVLCLTLSICSALLTWRLNGTLKEVRDTAAVTHRTADDLSTAVREQIEIFRSPAYQRNLEHSSELGDIAAKTVAQVARQTIPRANRALDELTARLGDLHQTTAQANRATSNLADFVARTDLSINSPSGLLPTATKIIDRTGITLDEFDRALKIAADGMNTTTEELRRRLADPRVDSMMDEALGILKESHGTMTEFHEASKQAPKLAADLEKIAKETSRFARLTMIANILGVLGRAFLP